MKDKNKVEEHNTWWCETCASKEEMTQPQMIDHLKSAHGLDAKGLKCKKQLQMHMDGATWFDYTWNDTVQNPVGGEISLTNSTRTKRSKQDQMYWG